MMPARPRPSRALLNDAAVIAAERGCSLRIEVAGTVVTVMPPGTLPESPPQPHPPEREERRCDDIFGVQP